jgi:ABC-type branched-subunit amino acid transport system ATPase component
VDRYPLSGSGDVAPLEVREVTKRFGGLAAVDGVSLSLSRGVVTALIGANGAGKSTLLGLISGASKLDGGVVVLDGTDVSRFSRQRRSRRGLASTFQHPQLVPLLTCLENVAGGMEAARRPASLLGSPFRRGEAAVLRRSAIMLELVGIPSDRWMLRSHQLSAQDRLLTELARALVSGPKVLLLDEPSVGFTAEETDLLISLLSRLTDSEGRSVLLVTHDITFAMRSAQRVYVMDHGQLICEGTPSAVIRNEQVVRAYLGEKGRESALKSLSVAEKDTPG